MELRVVDCDGGVVRKEGAGAVWGGGVECPGFDTGSYVAHGSVGS